MYAYGIKQIRKKLYCNLVCKNIYSLQKIKRNYSKITKPVAKWEPAKRHIIWKSFEYKIKSAGFPLWRGYSIPPIERKDRKDGRVRSSRG